MQTAKELSLGGKDDIMALTDRVIREKHLTAMMVTHNLRYAVEYGDRILMMNRGRVVLDRAGAAIPGLFAAGRCTSGLPAWGHGYSSGMSLADCTFFGRQAGRAAAA